MYKQITYDYYKKLVDAPICPCPWCKKTPELWMPLDESEGQIYAWVWRISCNCRVNSEASVSIRKTSKTDLDRFLNKFDELVDKWNHGNSVKAYEMKVLDLKEIPNLGL